MIALLDVATNISSVVSLADDATLSLKGPLISDGTVTLRLYTQYSYVVIYIGAVHIFFTSYSIGTSIRDRVSEECMTDSLIRR